MLWDGLHQTDDSGTPWRVSYLRCSKRATTFAGESGIGRWGGIRRLVASVNVKTVRDGHGFVIDENEAFATPSERPFWVTISSNSEHETYWRFRYHGRHIYATEASRLVERDRFSVVGRRSRRKLFRARSRLRGHLPEAFDTADTISSKPVFRASKIPNVASRTRTCLMRFSSS